MEPMTAFLLGVLIGEVGTGFMCGYLLDRYYVHRSWLIEGICGKCGEMRPMVRNPKGAIALCPPCRRAQTSDGANV